MRSSVVMMQNPCLFQVQALLANMAQQLLQDIAVVCSIYGHLWRDHVMVNGLMAIEEDDHENFPSRFLLADFFLLCSFLRFQCELSCRLSESWWWTQLSSTVITRSRYSGSSAIHSNASLHRRRRVSICSWVKRCGTYVDDILCIWRCRHKIWFTNDCVIFKNSVIFLVLR